MPDNLPSWSEGQPIILEHPPVVSKASDLRETKVYFSLWGYWIESGPSRFLVTPSVFSDEFIATRLYLILRCCSLKTGFFILKMCDPLIDSFQDNCFSVLDACRGRTRRVAASGCESEHCDYYCQHYCCGLCRIHYFPSACGFKYALLL